jgi:hypothetical protein
MSGEQKRLSWWRQAIIGFLRVIPILAIPLIMAGVLIQPVGPSLRMAQQSSAMQNSRVIGLSLFQYATDHQGHYPAGKTSTEVFQHLLDENYVGDASLFSIGAANRHIPGKVEPTSKHLKPENVCWDVTSDDNPSSPDGLPLVFLTGYKIAYQAGASALPINPPKARTWSQWWNGPALPKPFMAVCYKNNFARAISAEEDGSIPNFIPADFDPKGKTYRQLTPDGTAP